jgi:hypothetical protein
MAEPTLAEVVERLTALEEQMARLTVSRMSKLPRDGVGLMEDNEFTRAMLAAIEENSEAERRAAMEASE